LKWLVILLITVSIVEVINLLSGRMLNQFGTIPRYVPGLRGILFSPFIHGSFSHFLSNLLPLAAFSYLVMQYGFKRYVQVSIAIMVVTGLLVWLFARPATHIGASGLIYGYFGFLLLAGFLSRQFKLMLISLLVIFVYGGLIFGVVPGQSFVSWESHLFGFIAGLMAARLWAKPSR
jgi:membrane associated rhomboid family serine protease